MAFIKDFECRSCGSSLGRWAHNREIGREDMMCFVCGIGDFELSEYELTNLDYPSALVAIGRELGHCSTILPRINTPSSALSRRTASQRAEESLTFIVRDSTGITEGCFDAFLEVGEKVLEFYEQEVKEIKAKKREETYYVKLDSNCYPKSTKARS